MSGTEIVLAERLARQPIRCASPDWRTPLGFHLLGIKPPSFFSDQEYPMPKSTTSTTGRAGTAGGHQTRRSALRALAGASVLLRPTIGAIAGSLKDPIFAAIESHKAAYEARKAASFAIDDLIHNPEAREVSEAEWDALEQAHENENAAFDALLTAPPVTSLGMRAIIAHLISIDDGRLSHEMRQLLALLLESPLLSF
jgi:hypothetical protein